MKHKLRRQFTEEYREQQNSMKRIGLISDTHGTFDQTLKTFLKDVDEIWHAGDIGSPEVADQIAAFKPLRAVYGNIDGGIMRRTYREFLSFECEGVSVLMTHIGGYPRHYTPQAVARIQSLRPKIFIAGHSHILKVIYDPVYDLLHLNPALPAATVSTRCAAPCASPSTAPTSATWKSANGLVPALDKGTKSFNMQYFYLT